MSGRSVPAAGRLRCSQAARKQGLVGRRAKQLFASYAAKYRELADAPRRPLRATYLVLDSATAAELERVLDLVRRVAEERDIALHPIGARQLAERWALVGGEREHRLGANLATGGRLVAANGEPVPLREALIEARAQGGIARVILRQRFENPHDEPLLVRYQLPLPARGAVSAFRFEIDDRVIVGEIDKKARARERFEEALAKGHTAERAPAATAREVLGEATLTARTAPN